MGSWEALYLKQMGFWDKFSIGRDLKQPGNKMNLAHSSIDSRKAPPLMQVTEMLPERTVKVNGVLV